MSHYPQDSQRKTVTGPALLAMRQAGRKIAADLLRSQDIPVFALLGLTPQSVHRQGGYKVQGKTYAGHSHHRHRCGPRLFRADPDVVKLALVHPQ